MSWTSGSLAAGAPFPFPGPFAAVPARLASFNTFSDIATVFDPRTPLEDYADLRMYLVERAATPVSDQLQLRPFAANGDPSVLPDYDDYRALQHGFCFRWSYLAGSAPTTTLGGLIPTPYRSGIPAWAHPYSAAPDLGRCGPLPRFDEVRAATRAAAEDATASSAADEAMAIAAIRALEEPFECAH
jgi:hypothetical protein